MEEEGVEYKYWLTAGDTDVRDSHVAEGEQPPVKINEPFRITGLYHAGDQSGAPEEVINCRCVTQPVVD